MSTNSDKKSIKNEELVLTVSSNVDPAVWDETKYEAFLDALCEEREYQKDAIRSALRFLLSGRYGSLEALAKENFDKRDALREWWGTWSHFEKNLQFPQKLACSLDLATGTGKSFVLYGIAAILLSEGMVDRVLVLCPSNTIEKGLTEKFKELATRDDLRDLLPADSAVAVPRVISASETIVEGAICVENYHAILDNTKSSIRESLTGKGARVAVLNDEAHHVANETGSASKRWKEFLLNDDYGFKYIVGASGTCYVGDDYFTDVVYRYSLRQAIEERFVKRVEYVAEMPTTTADDEKWQLVWRRHESWRKQLKVRKIRPLTIVATRDIASCKQVAAQLEEWLCEFEKIRPEDARKKVLAISSAKEHTANVAALDYVDDATSEVEWIVSVSMLSEGWDVKNVFQIVPHEERAFNSKLLVAQVLGRGLRRPLGWTGADPMVTVFNHDAWSTKIRGLVNEILEIERRLTAVPIAESKYNFVLQDLDYTRVPEIREYPKAGEYRIFEQGFIKLPTQVEEKEVVVGFERAITGESFNFATSISQRTFSIAEVANLIHQRLKSIDLESATESDAPTSYAKKFPLKRCVEIVARSLSEAGITSGRVTDENRQRFLQALGTLNRKASKRIVYTLKADSLREVPTSERPRESVSAAELRRSNRKTIFLTEGCKELLPEEQQEFLDEVLDQDGDFGGAAVEVQNPTLFKTPVAFAIADASTERKFIRALVDPNNAKCIDFWLKNTSMSFYSIEYAWKRGVHTKRGRFSPDFFIKIGNLVHVVEIKDDEEQADPSAENVKKFEYAVAHFDLLNEKLKNSGRDERYQFNMIAPRDYNAFFQKLREGRLGGFRSGLDVAVADAVGLG